MQPLNSIRILDLTRLLPGAVCTHLLGAMGATIVKVEPPGEGDYARWMPPLIEDMGAYFRMSNAGKQSIVINLKDGAGQAVLHRLVETTDVLVESYRPGALARMHADYPTLKAINPRLVYCSISGWGQTGDYAHKSGHDLNYMALTGVIGEMSAPQALGGQVADVGGAYVAVAAICAALFGRTVTGEGAWIDTALVEAGVPMVGWAWTETLAPQQSGNPRGALSGRYAFYHIYPTRDGEHVALAALEPKFWLNFCRAIKRPDLVEDYLLPERQHYLVTELEQIFLLRSAAEWSALLDDADCCFSRVNTPETIANDPLLKARGTLTLAPDGTPMMGSPIRFMDTPDMPLQSVNPSPAPAMGEHTDAILRAAGYDDDAIGALRAAGSVG